ncbi:MULTISPECIES: polysaccharide pyruvyl transferase family protein [unclassified Flavobacterium]|uniref:polysaccharide pyruvyl transferase family protein n=1 Tax=unclassified Flavobacterium TaxID=196869 RepID=UPI00095D62CC|nr:MULTISPECIES: polysaccharide pyruvyl transferase family protein [unclassified Flavobacterium]MBN9285834.1 polysaccharide pyruvyl transferase family protein [Flavobacterium sp.]OJV70114.1 MAG: exosortase [Flavobacterium sp. 40-81]
MPKNENIRLFWWSEIQLANKKKENYGDLVGKYLVEKISGKKVIWIHPKKRPVLETFRTIYFTAGSILAQVNGKCIVWGSGIVSKEYKIKKAVFLAVRGPQTRKHLLAQGYDVPEIYGDPALLLPKFYNPERKIKYDLGIIPHYKDYNLVTAMYKDQENVLIIDLMTNDIEHVTGLILQCSRIISSSLHGVIVSQAYNIPAVWVKFSENIFGDGIKYQDYFESVGIKNYFPKFLSVVQSDTQINEIFRSAESIAATGKIKELQDNLMGVCPFK